MEAICRIEDLHLSYTTRGPQTATNVSAAQAKGIASKGLGNSENTVSTVLRGVNAAIHAGECIALYGRSGCGKSSLLNAIAGLEHYDSGAIWHGDKPLHTCSDDEICALRAQEIGIVYQAFNLLPNLTVYEQLALRLELVGKIDDGRIAELLDAVGLVDRQSSFPDQLSGGEQQRIAIAAALVHQPRLVLADEPTGNLDSAQAERSLDLLLRLRHHEQHQTAQTALVIATHDERIAQHADRVWRLDEGVIVEQVTDSDLSSSMPASDNHKIKQVDELAVVGRS